MTAKEYLGQIRLAEIKIRQLEERLASMRSLGGAIRYDKPAIQASPANMIEERMVELIDMEKEIEAEKTQQEALKNRITLEIQKLEDHRYVQALYYRYVLGMRAEEVSVVMGYEYASIRRILIQARAAFAYLMGLEQEKDSDLWAFAAED